jgi:hypothetical protein
LNQLDDVDGAPRLSWLPHKYSARLKLIVSTTPVTSGTSEITLSYEEIQKRKWNILTMQPLDSYDKESIVTEYLALFGKNFDANQLQR